MLNTWSEKEIVLQSKEGAFYSVRIIPYRTTDNTIDGVVLTFIDITEQKASMDKERLAIALGDSNGAITLIDLNGNIPVWNQGTEILYGYSPKAVLKMKITEITPSTLRKKMKKRMDTHKTGKRVQTVETQRRPKSGKNILVKLTMTAIRNKSGQIYAIPTTERGFFSRNPKGCNHFFTQCRYQSLMYV